MTTQITHVTVAEVWMDGELVWTGSYPRATRRQAIAYATNSGPARALLGQGHAVEVGAKRFIEGTDEEWETVRVEK